MLGCAVLLVGLQLLLHKDYREAAYLDSYGGLVASQLARLGQDAMVREDAIALNVLAEQVASEPAILEIEIYSMDGTTLASYTDGQAAKANRSREFTRPIQLGDATAGFVKVIVATNALQAQNNTYQTQQMQEWLRLAAAALLSALVMGFVIYSLTRSTANSEPDTGGLATSSSELTHPDTNRQSSSRRYLLLANLFNGNNMPAARRDALLSSTVGDTRAVAQLYEGQAVILSQTSAGILFDQTDTAERSFELACAALVLARLGNRPGGARYRYSLQELKLTESADPSESMAETVQAEHLEDALLHAALAEDNTVALAASVARNLPRPERLELTSEHSQALRALHACDPHDSSGYFLLSSANTTTLSKLERQVESLRAANTTPS